MHSTRSKASNYYPIMRLPRFGSVGGYRPIGYCSEKSQRLINPDGIEINAGAVPNTQMHILRLILNSDILQLHGKNSICLYRLAVAGEGFDS